MTSFDLIVLGGGPGGYVAAIKASQMGLKTALIEKDNVGGVCLNEGCIPTKTLMKSAKVFKTMKHASDYGSDGSNEAVVPNWSSILSRKSSVVQKLTGGVKALLKKNNVTVIQGIGNVLSPSRVQVNNEIYQTRDLIIATGASPIFPPIEGIKEAMEKNTVLSSKELLNYPKIPESLTIIGGGVIGVEFANIFATFGTKVTIIERMNQILLPLDDEIRSVYLKLLIKQGIQVISETTVTKVNQNMITYQKNNQEYTTSSEIILLSVGMKPNTSSFQTLNLKMDKQGVIVSERMETSIPHVYAIGDVTGKMMLAHAASAEAMVAVETILGKKSKFNYDLVPSAIYGFPEIAWIGLTESQVQAKQINFKVSKFPLLANGRSLAEGETDGLIKLISNTDTGELLGAHIIASNASELLSESVLAMQSESTVSDIAHAIHLHPSVSESVMEAALGALDKPIHF